MPRKFAGLTLLGMLGLTLHAHAVEGALGRPISGAAVNPYAGLIPPAPGWSFSVGEMYYEGDIGGSTSVPIGGNLVLDLSLKASFTPITAVYIWDTHSPRWNFASAVSLPVAWIEADASSVLGPVSRSLKQDEFGLFDIMVTPVVASYHISKTQHLAFNLNIWAPTGEYEEGALANLSLNNWTFIPGVAYTHLFPQQNIEFSCAWALQFYTENPATDYQNGILSDLELLAIKRFECGVGVGLVGSWLDQLSDDDGRTADVLNGFSGRAIGVGPIVTYTKKVGETNIDFNARWVHEFDVEKRFEGDLWAFNASVKF